MRLQVNRWLKNIVQCGLISLLCINTQAAIITKPDKIFSEIERNVAALMTQFHYEGLKLDEAMSERIFNHYLKVLDPQKIYFLQSDVDTFSRFKSNLAQDIKTGDLTNAFKMYDYLQSRIAQQSAAMLEFLNTDFDFTTHEMIDLDREKAQFARTQSELQAIWEQRLKYELLNLMLSDKTEVAAKETLKKRYQIRIKRLNQVEPRDAFQTYMSAMMESFDPHSSYFSPKASENFNISMSLKLNGIGTVLRQDEDTVKIVEVMPGGPADLSGQIHMSDEITGVAQGEDGEWLDIYGMRLDDVVDKIRGERGTVVRLQITSGKNKGSTKEVKLMRDTINLDKQAAQSSIKTISENGQDFKIGTITLPTFYSDVEGQRKGNSDARSTTKDVKDLIEAMKKENIDGLIIDLRGNGGGSLEEAINLSGLFLKGQTVVQTKGHDGKISEERSIAKEVFYAGPMIVLVDRLSASASEIFAGAMQDQGRALIVGSTTYGKGTVQTVLSLDRFLNQSDENKQKAGQAKFTIAKFYRASGSSTQHRGVEPDLHFPSVIDPAIIGESAQDYALPWDEIAPAKDFKPQNNFQAILPALIEAHNKRLKSKEDLLIYKEQVKSSLAAWREKTFSLNLTERQADQKDKEESNLKLYNQLRVLANLPELSLEKFKENNEFMTDEERKTMVDPVLNEGMRILADLIHLTRKS